MTGTTTVYSKPRCQQCTATKRWLKQHHVTFEEADATDPGNAEAIKYLGYMQAPVVVYAPDGPGSEVHWSGFNPIELSRHFEEKAP